jgi:hypothetical protein
MPSQTVAIPAPAIVGQLERVACALARRESAQGLNPAQWGARLGSRVNGARRLQLR